MTINYPTSLVYFLLLILTGCASKATISPAQLSATAPTDESCKNSPYLQRDLSTHATYSGSEQLYLTTEGKKCAF